MADNESLSPRFPSLATEYSSNDSVESSSQEETPGKLPEDYEETGDGSKKSKEILDQNFDDALQEKNIECISEPVPGSSKDHVKQESPDEHSVWLSPSTIKSEADDDEEKSSESEREENSEGEHGEEEKLDSDAEMDEESDEGAYHLAEVSYGEDDEDSQKTGGPESLSLELPLDYSKASGPRLETSAVNSSETVLAEDFIIQRKNIKTTNLVSGKTHYRNFECLICGYKAPQRSSLIDHIHKHTGERIHHCLHCNKKFRYKSYLMQHITVYHTDLAQYSCSLCSRKFVKESDFARHRRTHSGERPFPCSVCSYRAKNQGALKDHLRVHTKEKPYKCSQCEYSCAYSTLLTRHVSTKHETNTFTCDVCDYKATIVRNYKEHLKTHTNDKQHFCDKCDYKSHRKESLRTHIANRHTVAPLFQCAVCDAKFKQLRSLKHHMNYHKASKQD